MGRGGVSGPSYRITTERLPDHAPSWPWHARIHRISDGEYEHTSLGETEDDALEAAARWIADKNAPVYAGGVYEADEEGNISPLRPSPTWPQVSA